jgi:hypothetical protein
VGAAGTVQVEAHTAALVQISAQHCASLEQLLPLATQPDGVTALDALDAGPVPAAFVAVTVNVYDVPLLKPVTVWVVLDPADVNPPGLDVTV